MGNLVGPDGLTVLVLDEGSQVKQGERTAGVKPQYVGCAGRVTNAINFVSATYSTRAGHREHVTDAAFWACGRALTPPTQRKVGGRKITGIGDSVMSAAPWHSIPC